MHQRKRDARKMGAVRPRMHIFKGCSDGKNLHEAQSITKYKAPKIRWDNLNKHKGLGAWGLS